MHQILAAQDAEDDGKDRSTQQQGEHHGGDGGRGQAGLLQHAQAEAALDGDEQQGAHRTHGGGLGGGGNAAQDGAQDGQDQRQGRQQCRDDLAAQTVAAFFALEGRGRAGLGIEDGLAGHVEHVQPHQHGTGQDGADEQVAHRDRGGSEVALGHLHLGVDAREHVAHEDEDGGRRDDLAQRAGGRNHACPQLGVIAGTQHGGQADEAHGDDGGAHHAGGGGQQRAHDDDREAQTSPDVAEEPPHGGEQGLGDARSFEQHAHEDEERHGHQHLAGHEAHVAGGEGAEVGEVEDLEVPADGSHHQRGAGQRVGNREAQRQHEDDAEEQGAGQDLAQQDRIHFHHAASWWA